LDEYIKANQDWWNEAAQVHARGEAYQLQAFKEGMIKLHPLASLSRLDHRFLSRTPVLCMGLPARYGRGSGPLYALQRPQEKGDDPFDVLAKSDEEGSVRLSEHLTLVHDNGRSSTSKTESI
jgi:hypothetical protein